MPPEGPKPSQPTKRGRAIVFAYEAEDGTKFSSETTRGRPTYVTFLTTYDMGSQVQAREINRIVMNVKPRVNAGALVLESADHGVMVSAFQSALDLSYPLVLLGSPHYDGPFGEIDRVPVTILLDAWGVEVWRKAGLATPRELYDALALASPR